jgi:chromosome segregation ATPase
MANVHAFEITKESPYSDAAPSVLLNLRADVSERVGRLEASLAEINNAIAERCAPAVTEARSELQKFEGRVRVVVEGIEVVSDVPKRVEWSTERLDEIADRIESNGLAPEDFIDHKLSVSEKKYAALPKPLRDLFDTARVVKHGKERLDFPNA